MLMVNLSVVAGLLCFWLKQQASCSANSHPPHHQRVHVCGGGVQDRGALPDQPSFSRNWILFTGTLKMFPLGNHDDRSSFPRGGFYSDRSSHPKPTRDRN